MRGRGVQEDRYLEPKQAKMEKEKSSFHMLLSALEAEHDREIAALGGLHRTEAADASPFVRSMEASEVCARAAQDLSHRVSELSAKLEGLKASDIWEASAWRMSVTSEDNDIPTNLNLDGSTPPVSARRHAGPEETKDVKDVDRKDVASVPSATNGTVHTLSPALRSGSNLGSIGGWASSYYTPSFRGQQSFQTATFQGSQSRLSLGDARQQGMPESSSSLPVSASGMSSIMDVKELIASLGADSDDEVELTPWERVVDFVGGDKLDMIVATLICLNTLVMAFEMQYLGLDACHHIGYTGCDKTAEDAWPGGELAFIMLDRIFTIIFTIEVSTKIFVLRWKYLRILLNWLDVFVVAVSLADWIGAGLPLSPSVGRLLRLLKLGRGLRLLKTSAALDCLALLLKCLVASVNTLFWSLCLLGIIQCIAAMIIGQLVNSYIQDDTKDLDARKEVFAYYGTFTRAMLTMFEVTMANWAPACRVLVDNISESYSAFFLFYRCVIGFAALGVITAVFIQQTMSIASRDEDIMLQKKRQEMHDNRAKFERIFQRMDKNKDGHLSLDEFTRLMRDPSLKTWMAALELDIYDVYGFFKMVANQDDGLQDEGPGISYNNFIANIGRLKGGAKQMDIIKIMKLVENLDRKLDAMQKGQSKEGLSGLSTVAEKRTKSKGEQRPRSSAIWD